MRITYFLSSRASRRCSFAFVFVAFFVLFGNAPHAAAQGFVGVNLKVADQTVPPGGLLQMQVFLTEPKPILKGGQRMTFSSKAQLAVPLGVVQDGALFSPAGDVDGVAVLGKGSIQVAFSSPLTSFGTELDTPVMAFGVPVSVSAVKGQTVPLVLDAASALWLDPSGNQYPVELSSGVLTVGGATSIKSVSPATGIIPAGSVITITGVGFQPTSKVAVNNAVVAKTTFISATQIQITLSSDFAIEGQRIRVTTGNERVEFYPYQRVASLKKSTHALVASSYALFSHNTWTTAFFHPVLQGSVFSGLALQNLNTSSATVTIKLFSTVGGLLATRNLTLPVNTRLTRDLVEIFPGQVPGNGTTVTVTSSLPIQMLGLLGDDAAGTMAPVEPAAQ